MSRFMKITVTINPYYEKDLEGTYPKLGWYLRHHDPTLADQNPSLYKLAGMMDQLLFRFDGTKLRDALLLHEDKLRALYKNIEADIADRNLSRADKFLYQVEDIFDEIELQLE